METIEVDENTVIGDVLRANRFSARIFMEFGMSCLGCGHTAHETIAEACAVHDVNTDELVAQLNDFFMEQAEME